jgi:hypothetical protein
MLLAGIQAHPQSELRQTVKENAIMAQFRCNSLESAELIQPDRPVE